MKKIIINYSVPILFSSVIISLILSVLYFESEMVFSAVVPAVCGIFFYFRYFTDSFLNEEYKITDRKKAFLHIFICIMLLIIAYYSLTFAKNFIITSVFVSFIVYYEFTVRYNALITFLFTIIPCALYASNYIEINSIYFCALVSLYFLFMLVCKKNQMEKYAEVIYGKGYYVSLAVLAAVFFITAALVPELDNTPYNFFRNIRGFGFGGRVSTDYSGHLSRYSGNGAPQGEGLDEVLFLVKAEDTVYLRRQVMGDYVGDRGAFRKLQGDYFKAGYKNWEGRMLIADLPALFYQIKEAGHTDEAFRKKYEDIIAALPEAVETTGTATITYVGLSTNYIPITLRTYSVSGETIDRLNHYRLPQGTIFLDWENNEKIIPGNSFNIEYYDEQIYISKELQDFTALLTLEKYTNLIYDLYAVNDSFTVEEYVYQLHELDEYQKEIKFEIPVSIRELAEKVTEGKEGDYERALALESYFANNGYEYDPEYISEKDESIEHFIFIGKRGTCSSYAAAMTLMARAVGLPTRYVEGFKTGEKNDDGVYEITPLNAHAFPEIFISGYGWVTFEPTVPYKPNLLKLYFDKNVNKLFVFTVVVLASSAIIVFLYRFISEKADEWIFRRRFAVCAGKTFAIMMYTRMQKLVSKNSGIDVRTLTPGMFSGFVFERYEIDLLPVIHIFEQAVYGDFELPEEARGYLTDKYIEFYRRIKNINNARTIYS